MVLVSAVITTHKRAPEYVERAILSILSQTYKNIETIVVDDSPADYELRPEVEKTVLKYADSGVRYIPHEKCMGACAARNTGLENSNGEFIAYLDDDDVWLKEKAEQQLACFDSDAVALVYSGYEAILPDGKTRKYPPRGAEGNVYDELVISNFIGSTSFPMIRKSALLEIGGFDVLMQSSQDYDVWLRLAEKYEVRCTHSILGQYTLNPNECITSNPKKKIAGLERLNMKLSGYLSTHREARWQRRMVLVRYYAANRQPFKALWVWFKTAWLRPLQVKNNIRFLYMAMLKYFKG